MNPLVRNPLVRDRDAAFLLYEVFEAERLAELPAFADQGRESWELFLGQVRRLAREALFPAYRPMDAEPPTMTEGGVRVHPSMRGLFARMVEMGLLSATRPPEVGGQSLPLTIFGIGSAYLMAANLSAYGYVGLTMGAARLVESFGSDSLRETYMQQMYAGEWTGTMALTEPDAGSGLADVRTRATPAGDHHLISGTKIFISGGDQDLTENVVHLTLARIDGAPAGTRGISLFVVPKKRLEEGMLVDNDCSATQLLHKIGWRGLPSVALTLGERGECRGYLLGEPNRGLSYMFQMMNEARLMVGWNGAATASAAYHEALAYAKTRLQGRPAGARDPASPPVPIVEHADVRRMLLRQKAIVEGSLSLLVAASRLADLAEHAPEPEARRRALLLLDLLTPVAKSFPAERGFEACSLALQVHGGYGYTSEYLPEAWLRDQKLNSIHEGTTGIQGLDLLGRKAIAEGGRALALFSEEVGAAVARARGAGLDESLGAEVASALSELERTTMALGARGASGDVEGMLLHSADYLELFSTLAIGWQWLLQAAVAREKLPSAGEEDRAFYEGKLCAARYWIRTELPRIPHLARLCLDPEDSYARAHPDWL